MENPICAKNLEKKLWKFIFVRINKKNNLKIFMSLNRIYFFANQ